ncbi:hypothetical protein D918_08686 [Trichuris suis]|nr:hypothetical protein D918_08686 [Trichuris suis]
MEIKPKKFFCRSALVMTQFFSRGSVLIFFTRERWSDQLVWLWTIQESEQQNDFVPRTRFKVPLNVPSPFLAGSFCWPTLSRVKAVLIF